MYFLIIFFVSLLPFHASAVAPKKFNSHITAPRAIPKPPRKISGSLIKPLIVLDPGHGGYDEGAKVGSVYEKKLSLTTALLTKKLLEDRGYRVILTRSKDVYIPLDKRAAIANNNESDLFVSIHYNAAKNPTAKGIEVFYYNQEKAKRTKSSKALANSILYHLIDQTLASSRGVKKGNHHVTRETTMPAVMVEGGFITNPDERSNLKERTYLEKVAEGIAEGVDKYMREKPRV